MVVVIVVACYLVVVVVVVAFSSRARIFWRIFDNSFPAHAFFFFFLVCFLIRRDSLAHTYSTL